MFSKFFFLLYFLRGFLNLYFSTILLNFSFLSLFFFCSILLFHGYYIASYISEDVSDEFLFRFSFLIPAQSHFPPSLLPHPHPTHGLFWPCLPCQKLPLGFWQTLAVSWDCKAARSSERAGGACLRRPPLRASQVGYLEELPIAGSVALPHGLVIFLQEESSYLLPKG